jgi:putative tryptophan/tyrosine transport system substrate-binding protein
LRRRELILVLGGGMVLAPAVCAQQKAMPLVGCLSISPPPPSLADLSHDLVHEGLRELGYVDGQNIVSEYRWAEFHYDRLPALAAELVSRKVDVIVALSGTPTALAARNATSTIPIVFINVGDPVGMGFVASLAKPGGNITGFSNVSTELTAKQLELLSELVPQAGVIALLVNPNNANAEGVIRYAQEAAHAKNVQLSVQNASTEAEIEAAFASLDQLHASGLVVDADGFISSRLEQVVTLAGRHAIPAVYARSPFVAAGGLISYGIDDSALYHQAGIYVGKILKGAKPAELPVQQPTTFELVVNLDTAKALGLTVPPSILARADEVIE